VNVVSSRWQRRLLTLAGACALATFALAVRIHENGDPLGVDQRADSAVGKHVWGVPLVPYRVALNYRALGASPWFELLVSGVILVAWRKRDALVAVLAVASPGTALLLAEHVGKPLVARYEFGSYGFPSGHTTAISSLAGVVALLAYRTGGGKRLVRIAPALGAAVVGMMLAVVRVRSHYFSDALAGILLGGGTAAGLVALASAGLVLRVTRRGGTGGLPPGG
jgi:membrane-associated phospholipid phosphatase